MSSKKTGTTAEENKEKSALVPRLRFRPALSEGGWTLRRLGEIARFTSGGTPSKDEASYWNGSIPWISASSMYETRIANSELKVTPLAIGNGTRIAPKGSLLVLVRGSMLFNRVPIGIAAIDVAFNQDVKALSICGDANADFLLFQLIAASVRIPVNETGIGAGKIETDVLAGLPIYLPSPTEQQKIADCLSSLDELITAEIQKLDALKTHKKGLMQQLFPREGETVPRLRFPEFREAGEWVVKTLSELAENLDNRRIPVTESDRIRGAIPYYGASGIVDYIHDFIFDEDLLCISEDGANLVARTTPIAFSISGKTWVNNHAHVLKFDRRCVQKIVEDYLNSVSLEDYLTGMAQPKLNRAMLDTIPVPVPQDVDEQQAVADCLSSLDDLITAQSQRIVVLKTHKKGLMQQLFPVLDEVQK